MQNKVTRPIRIGIVGAGISGLTMAYNLNKIYKGRKVDSFIHVLQCRSRPGGRIKCIQQGQYSLDLGANLIDFQTQKAYQQWQELLPQSVTKSDKLKTFKLPFLLYETKTKQLRKGDYQKNRYYYQGGFKKMIFDIIKELECQNAENTQKDNKKSNIVNIQYDSEVLNIKLNQQVEMQYVHKRNNQILSSRSVFDKVYISCPTPQCLKILNNPETKQQGTKKELGSIIDFIKANQTQYTKQLSVAFKTKAQITLFSCILFREHPILTFVCSHQEKYGQKAFVVQLSQEFSQQYFNADNKIIQQKVYENLPEQLKQMVDQGFGIVERWSPSLIKIQKRRQNQNNQKDATLIVNQMVNIVGDSVQGKSRVSGAVQSVARLLARL